MKRLLLAALWLWPLAARADARFVMRMATVAPDGTAWARELHAFTREIADATQGEVRMKWYFGGIAGDDLQVEERMKRDQLDGVGSGGMLCERFSAAFRGLRAPGLYRTREEVRFVAGQLRPSIEQEFRQEGYSYLGHATLGPIVAFTRSPARTLDELKRLKLWSWEFDQMLNQPLEAMGAHLVKLPLESAGAAFAEGKTDGWYTVPAAALAFQWSSQARYITQVSSSFLVSCLLVTQRSLDRLPIAHQQAIRAATAKLSGRLEEVGAEQDAKLLGGLFGRQGLEPIAVSESFRNEFAAAARAAGEKLGAKLLAPAIAQRVAELLGQYRAQHPR